MPDESVEAGEIFRDEAIARAAKRAAGEDATFPERALAHVIGMAKMHQRLTSEDVIRWARVAGIETPEPRAWGSVMRRAMLRGVISFDFYDKSTNPQAHRRPVAVWRSNIYEGATGCRRSDANAAEANAENK